MDRPSDSQLPAAPAPQKKTLRTQYLTLYNLVSAVLWLRVFWSVVLIVTVGGGWEKVFAGADENVRYVQTAALLEVVHAALGKSSTFSNSMLHAKANIIPTTQASSALPSSPPSCKSPRASS
jgi:hypothetical protein